VPSHEERNQRCANFPLRGAQLHVEKWPTTHSAWVGELSAPPEREEIVDVWLPNEEVAFERIRKEVEARKKREGREEQGGGKKRRVTRR